MSPYDENADLIFVAISSIVNLIVAIGAGIWALANSRNFIDEKIAKKERYLSEDLIDMERRLRTEIDNSERNVGETVAAIKEHVRLIELWSRDNLASKVDIEDLKNFRNRFEDNLIKRLDHIDKKLNKINGDVD